MAPTLKKAQPWTPHAQAAPITEHEGETFYTTANGTHTLSGGWQLEYENVVPGARYRISTEVALQWELRGSEVNWRQRRPDLYGVYVEAGNTGPP